MTEAQAFRWIQKTSMDRRQTMRAVAEEVLAEAEKAAADAGGEAAGGSRREAAPGTRSQLANRPSPGSVSRAGPACPLVAPGSLSVRSEQAEGSLLTVRRATGDR